ncbi:hypothetical protein AB0C80_18380 [Streptomyces anthocyanicus]|uniref:hypothetical protein n=1 Tax=Streptomyces anthocyanicus TaxID=68174 RepID=UPI0033FC5EDA
MSTERHGQPTPQTLAIVQQLLGEMAGRLETKRPNATITTIGRHALLQATTMDPPVLRALREVAPEIDVALTRRQYAARLRTAAKTMTRGDTREALRLAARVLVLAADRLDTLPLSMYPVTGSLPTDRCMTAGLQDLVVGAALDTVLGPVTRHAVQEDTRTAVRAMLPPPAGSVADHAALLRKVAGVVA